MVGRGYDSSSRIVVHNNRMAQHHISNHAERRHGRMLDFSEGSKIAVTDILIEVAFPMSSKLWPGR